MIQFSGVSARHAFSYRTLDFAFNGGLTAIEGVNGSSKSSLFLTLQQGLFNRNAKGCKVDEVNNRITGEPYEITVDFLKGADRYSVVNSRKDGRIDIIKNGKNIALKRIPENLLLIQEILGCDFSMFGDLTYQNKDSSLDLLETGTDRGRKQFINRVLRLTEIDEQLARMKEKEKELAGKSGRIAFLKGKIDAWQASLGTELAVGEEEPVAGYLEARAAINEEIDLLKEEKRCLTFSLHEVSGRWERRDAEISARRRIAEIEKELKGYVRHDLDAGELQETIDQVRGKETELWVASGKLKGEIERAEQAEAKQVRRGELQEEIDEIQTGSYSRNALTAILEEDTRYFAGEAAVISQIEEKIEEFETAIASGDCPTCGAPVPKETFESDLVIMREDVRRRKARVQSRRDLDGEYRDCLAAFQRKEKLEREIDRLGNVTCQLDIGAARETLQSQERQLRELQGYIQDQQETIRRVHRIAELDLELALLKGTLSGADPYEDLEQLREEYGTALACVEDDLRGAEGRRETLYEDLSAIEAGNATVRARRELNRQIAENNEQILLQIDQGKKELEEAQRRLDCVKEWLGILGNRGYRVAKIDRFLKALNATMGRYSTLICEGRIRASFFITEEGEIDFTITDEAKSMDYTLWSGGEKARVRLVALFAVLELLEVMGSVSFNVLCLDEVFDQLDMDGKAGLFRVLEHLKGKEKALYVIAHSELALDLVYDGVVRARKEQDGTTRLLQAR